MCTIAVIDARGGGFGKAVIEAIRSACPFVQILALGTNVMATMAMRKAGAHSFATGENAIVVNVKRVDMIVGGIGIIAADSMLGEITRDMAYAIASSDAMKILVPFGKCNISVPGTGELSLKQMIEQTVSLVKQEAKRIDG